MANMNFDVLMPSFLKPKWKHRNPDVRKLAVTQLSDNERDILLKIAQLDSDPTVRCVAINKVTDLDQLLQLSFADNDTTVLTSAQQRLGSLLAGQKGKTHLEERIKTIGLLEDQAILEHIALNAAESEIRALVIEKLDRQSLLGDLAINEPFGDNRLACCRRITQKSTLERVVKQSRKKDKRVFKVTKEKLDRLIEQDERPQRLGQECSAICEELAKLLSRDRGLQEEQSVHRMQKRWQEIKEFSDEGSRIQFDALCNKIDAALSKAKQAQAAEQKLVPFREQKETDLTKIQNKLTALQAEHPNDIDQVQLKADLDIVFNQWHTITKLPDEAERSYQDRFEQLFASVQTFQSSTEKQQHATIGLQRICEQVEALLHGNKAIDPKAIAKFEVQWGRLTKPENSRDFDSYKHRFSVAIDALKGRVNNQSIKCNQYIASLKADLVELNRALDDGILQQAKKIHKHANKTAILINNLASDSTPDIYALKAELRGAHAKITQLAGWHDWASVNERNHLCQQAEELIGKNDDLEETAHQIRELQSQWKRLKGQSPDDLWEKFNNSCNQAYEPCKAYFQAQAIHRDNSMEAKSCLCAQLEEYVDKMDWTVRSVNKIDWKKVEFTLKQARKEWDSIGPVDRKSRKDIETRFRKVLDNIHSQILQEKERNTQAKQKLIAEAKLLVQLATDDLNTAIEKIKDLQAKWQKLSQTCVYRDQKLWNQFKQIADEIFAKRQQAAQDRIEEYKLSFTNKQAICAEITALCNTDDSPDALRNQFATIEQRWKEVGLVPKEKVHEIASMYKKACEEFNRHLKERTQQSIQQALELLAHKASLCEKLEKLAWQDTPVDQARDAIHDEWSQLAVMDKETENGIAKRFHQSYQNLQQDAVKISKEGLQANLESNRQIKELLCIRMEIMANKESPPEAKNTRMEYQVQRLSEAMYEEFKTDSAPQSEDGIALQKQWFYCGVTHADIEEKLKQRFDEAYNAFVDTL